MRQIQISAIYGSKYSAKYGEPLLNENTQEEWQTWKHGRPQTFFQGRGKFPGRRAKTYFFLKDYVLFLDGQDWQGKGGGPPPDAHELKIIENWTFSKAGRRSRRMIPATKPRWTSADEAAPDPSSGMNWFSKLWTPLISIWFKK